MPSGGERTARPTKVGPATGRWLQVRGYKIVQRVFRFLAGEDPERACLREIFVAGVSERAKARARSASSVRSRRNGVIDTQPCSTAQRSVPSAAPCNGVTVNQKIERPIGSLSGTTLPS